MLLLLYLLVFSSATATALQNFVECLDSFADYWSEVSNPLCREFCAYILRASRLAISLAAHYSAPSASNVEHDLVLYTVQSHGQFNCVTTSLDAFLVTTTKPAQELLGEFYIELVRLLFSAAAHALSYDFRNDLLLAFFSTLALLGCILHHFFDGVHASLKSFAVFL